MNYLDYYTVVVASISRPGIAFCRPEYHHHTNRLCALVWRIGQLLTHPMTKSLKLLAGAIRYSPGVKVDSCKTRQVFNRIVQGIAAKALFLGSLVPFSIGGVLRMISNVARARLSVILKQGVPCTVKKYGLFTVLSQNGAALHGPVGTLNGLRDMEERIYEFADHVLKTGADIYCGQEIFCDFASFVMCKRLKKIYPYMIHTVDPSKSDVFVNSGLFFASKFPIKACGYRRFSRKMGADVIAQKGILLVTLDIGGNCLLVTNTHLQAHEGLKEACVRSYQLQEVQDAIDEYIKNSEDLFAGVINAGDYNMQNYPMDLPEKDFGPDLVERNLCLNYKSEKRKINRKFFKRNRLAGFHKSNYKNVDPVKSTWYNEKIETWGTKDWNPKTPDAMRAGDLNDLITLDSLHGKGVLYEKAQAVLEDHRGKVSPCSDHAGYLGIFRLIE